MTRHNFTDAQVERSIQGAQDLESFTANGPTVTVIAPPMVQTMMTGVAYAKIYASGFTRLYYTDGTTEGANLTIGQLAQGRENFFSLVSAVQDHRPDTLRHDDAERGQP